MPKPADSKSLQIYPHDELYLQLKELVERKVYRSMNAAALALIEIGLKNRVTKLEQESLNEDVENLIKDILSLELPRMKEQILKELRVEFS